MIIVRTEVEIDAPIRVCFDCARDIGLHTRTVWKHTKESAVGGVTDGPIGLGETVTFEATHFLVRQRLTSQITEYREPCWFVDEMRRGAFKSLRHEHEFQEAKERTLMTDTLLFEAPFGVIGTVTERLVLGRYMRKFLEHRNLELKRVIEHGEYRVV
ncbi:SRPBCC family protein [Cohnella zeiphila]|uniref:SRPBCC family protein n=1 Tax=Cohnella zeiphila TaxID=2761120 RepID=A0A7X0VVS9_9BACL|nr:SRPBCC family protein [Cohnella zeiphila]MBB6731692.1 SRPBCC family protein [Cohnella zeiphila]